MRLENFYPIFDHEAVDFRCQPSMYYPRNTVVHAESEDLIILGQDVMQNFTNFFLPYLDDLTESINTHFVHLGVPCNDPHTWNSVQHFTPHLYIHDALWDVWAQMNTEGTARREFRDQIDTDYFVGLGLEYGSYISRQPAIGQLHHEVFWPSMRNLKQLGIDYRRINRQKTHGFGEDNLYYLIGLRPHPATNHVSYNR